MANRESIDLRSKALPGQRTPWLAMDNHPFLKCLANSDIAGASAWIEDHPDESEPPAYKAHPLLQAFVASNNGRLHQKTHLQIAELLTPELVCAFRDSVLNDQVDEVT